MINCEIEKDEIVIRIPVEYLPVLYSEMKMEEGDESPPEITDEYVFANSIIEGLNIDYHGFTQVENMVWQAMQYCEDVGLDGIAFE